MHVLAIIAIPAIVLTSFAHSGAPPAAPSALAALSPAERARIAVAQGRVPRGGAVAVARGLENRIAAPR